MGFDPSSLPVSGGFPIALIFAWIAASPVVTDQGAAITRLDLALVGSLVVVMALVSYQQFAPHRARAQPKRKRRSPLRAKQPHRRGVGKWASWTISRRSREIRKRCERASASGSFLGVSNPQARVGFAFGRKSPISTSLFISPEPCRTPKPFILHGLDTAKACVRTKDCESRCGRTQGADARFVEFCDPSLREKAPEGPEWIYEVKTDGYRAQVHVGDGKVTVYSRSGYDWTEQFAAITGSDFLMDGGVTASYWFGELAPGK